MFGAIQKAFSAGSTALLLLQHAFRPFLRKPTNIPDGEEARQGTADFCHNDDDDHK